MTIKEALLEIASESGIKTYALNPGRSNSFDELFVDFQSAAEEGGERYTVFLHPKKDIVIKRLEIRFSVQITPGARFFVNGYQSWSESRLLPVHDTLPRLRGIAKPFMGRYGDEWIGDVPRDGLHSWTYTYLTTNQGQIRYWGSVQESTGFTLFYLDARSGVLSVRKDLAGLHLSHSFPALDFWTGEGPEGAMFDAVGRIFN